MKILEYLKPENPIAKWIVVALLFLFAFWFGVLILNLWQHRSLLNKIKRCRSVDGLRPKEDVNSAKPTSSIAFNESSETIFRSFVVAKDLHPGEPISRHLRAIFDAGRNESQLDPRGLIKNTTDELFRINSLHRSVLSIFIILGLLGTLFGLADSMASLDSLLHGTSQLNNDTLSQGLQGLLGTLRGAFAPSIWGVSLTVLGVLLFAFYMRVAALPLSGLLERMTLTVWVPQLVPTPSQKLRERLQLSRDQMERSVDAAKQVTEFAEDIQSKTGTLRETLGLTTDAFKQMTEVAERLDSSSRHFETGVMALVPFQDDLRTLYQQMKDESRAFQESVQRNIAGSEDFQQRIQGQLNSQHQELVRVLSALQSYETAYLKSREGIDENLLAVSKKAEHAFESLSRRNEEITQALDTALGKPLREDLTQRLGGVEAALHTGLGEMKGTLEVQLVSLGEKLGRLDVPLNTVALKFDETFSNFEQSTREWLAKQQLEFAKQNDTGQQQLQRLESLSEQVPKLLEQLTTSSNNFSESSSTFATHGQQLSQHTNTLSRDIATLGRGVDLLSKQFSANPSDGDHAAAVISQLTNLVEELRKRSEGSRWRR